MEQTYKRLAEAKDSQLALSAERFLWLSKCEGPIANHAVPSPCGIP